MPQQSPLHAATTKFGAVFAEDAGWQMPAHYGDPVAEYRAACEQIAVFDISHHGKIEVVGKDARTFLHNLSTNDIKSLPAGQSCEAFFGTNKAKAIGFAEIHHRGVKDNVDTFWLDVGPGQGEKVFQHLDRHLISEKVDLTDRTQEFAQFHVAGPAGDSIRVNPRWTPLGLPGFDLIVPASEAANVWEFLTGAVGRPAGLQALEILRIEAGLPIYGKDIDDERFVVELDRTARAISYSKGCYLGQEPIVMARDRGHVNRHFRGLIVGGDAPLPSGTKLFRDGGEVGQVTSSVVSPRFGSIALAYVRRGSDEPGTKLETETSTAQMTVEVVGLPFGASGSRASS
jgi:tRNA-modifying protein YgfZ